MSYHATGKFIGLADWKDTVGDIGSSIGKIGGGLLDILGTPQREAARAAVLEEAAKQQAALQAAQAGQPTGFDLQKALPWIALGGGVLLIVLLAQKKKKEG